MDERTMNGAAIHAPGGEPGSDPNGDGPKMGVPPVTVTLEREQSSANAHNQTLNPPHAEDHDTEMPIWLA